MIALQKAQRDLEPATRSDDVPGGRKQAGDMKRAVLFGMALLLTGCGGGTPRQAPASLVVPEVAFGPIRSACLQSDRSARSPQLCGCIQATADRTLSPADQRRSVAFYTDPHLAQQVRQSDRSDDERFWKAYVAYSESAARQCG